MDAHVDYIEEKPHSPMQSTQSYLLFAIVPAELKFVINMANFESVFMTNENLIANSTSTFDRLNSLNTQTLSQFILN